MTMPPKLNRNQCSTREILVEYPILSAGLKSITNNDKPYTRTKERNNCQRGSLSNKSMKGGSKGGAPSCGGPTPLRHDQTAREHVKAVQHMVAKIVSSCAKVDVACAIIAKRKRTIAFAIINLVRTGAIACKGNFG
jgi:hypothetical protein